MGFLRLLRPWGQAPCQTVCGICRFFQTMHGGVSDPSFFVFIHRVAFKEVSGHRVLMKSAFSPGKEQAAGVWETCLAPGWRFALQDGTWDFS